MTSPEDIRTAVHERYAEAARRAESGMASSCCAEAACGPGPMTAAGYAEADLACLPAKAVLASLGCGNPVALAELREGEIVLDLGSGGGIDVLLSARRVGPAGRVYGVDQTDEMLALARANARNAGARNAEFLQGDIEAIPLPDASVDVIISNCVINLSADKARVLREAFRVLKPGGRLAISDIVVRGGLPAPVRRNMELWVGCVAGALEEEQLMSLLATVGFIDATIEPTRVYHLEDARAMLAGTTGDADVLAREIGGRVMGAFVRARKPELP